MSFKAKLPTNKIGVRKFHLEMASGTVGGTMPMVPWRLTAAQTPGKINVGEQYYVSAHRERAS